MGAIQRQAGFCRQYLDEQLEQRGCSARAWSRGWTRSPWTGRPLVADQLEERLPGRRHAGDDGGGLGPHPQKGAMDEFELLQDWEVWQHVVKSLKEGRPAGRSCWPARPGSGGTGRSNGCSTRGAFKVMPWCVYDVMARCEKDCHNVPGYGRCPLWSRVEINADGEHEVPMCHGRAKHATGHLTWAEVVNMYLADPDPVSWGSVMELRRPGAEGLFFGDLSLRRGCTCGTSIVRARAAGVPGVRRWLRVAVVARGLAAAQRRAGVRCDEIYRPASWSDDSALSWRPAPGSGTSRRLGGPDRAGGARGVPPVLHREVGKAVMHPAENNRVAGWKAMRGRHGQPGKPPMIGLGPRAAVGVHRHQGARATARSRTTATSGTTMGRTRRAI